MPSTRTPAQQKKALNKASPAFAKSKAGDMLVDMVAQGNAVQADLATLIGKWNTANPGNTVTVTSAQVTGFGLR